MAEEDDFDIDIYGDEQPEYVQEPADQITEDAKHDDSSFAPGPDGTNVGRPPNEPETEPGIVEQAGDQLIADTVGESSQEEGGATYQAGTESAPNPDQTAPFSGQHNGDQQEKDPNATAALRLTELQWWDTEDDLRGWANDCSVEDQIKDITFNEHKANGKSKGYVVHFPHRTCDMLWTDS